MRLYNQNINNPPTARTRKDDDGSRSSITSSPSPSLYSKVLGRDDQDDSQTKHPASTMSSFSSHSNRIITNTKDRIQTKSEPERIQLYNNIMNEEKKITASVANDLTLTHKNTPSHNLSTSLSTTASACSASVHPKFDRMRTEEVSSMRPMIQKPSLIASAFSTNTATTTNPKPTTVQMIATYTSTANRTTSPSTTNNTWERPNITLGLTPFSLDALYDHIQDDDDNDHQNENDSDIASDQNYYHATSSSDRHENHTTTDQKTQNKNHHMIFSLQAHNSISSSQPFDPTQSSLWVHLPPHTNWSIQDNKLKCRSALFPPYNRYCTTYVGDASPSIVAARISECLRKNNVCVEYDDDAATATALTSDHVYFQISLFRGGKGSVAFTSHETSARVDLSHGVIIECSRIRGDTISFHRMCRVVLLCARGESDGMDLWKKKNDTLQQTLFGLHARDYCPSNGEKNPWEEHHHEKLLPMQNNSSVMSSISITVMTLGKALVLLEKDRFDAQRLGMETLVYLTDTYSSSVEVAIQASLCILGAPLSDETTKIHVDDHSLHRIHEWIQSLVVKRCIPSACEGSKASRKSEASSKQMLSNDQNHDIVETDIPSSSSDVLSEHLLVIRLLALRVLANAFQVLLLHRNDDSTRSLVPCEQFVNLQFINAIDLDLRGSGRPPSVSLGSSHEATLSGRCLHLCTQFLRITRRQIFGLVHVDKPPNSFLEVLDRAFVAGLSTHYALECECKHIKSVFYT